MTGAFDPDRPAQTPLIVLAVLVVGGVLAVAFGPDLLSLLPLSADQRAVATVVEEAIAADQTVLIPPERDTGGHVTPGAIRSMHDQVLQTAQRLFTGAYRDAWIVSHQDAIDRVGSVDLIFDGGAYGCGRWHVGLDGEQATAKVRCHLFLETALTVDGPRSRIENVADFDLALVQIGGAWLVTSATFEFAPGGGP